MLNLFWNNAVFNICYESIESMHRDFEERCAAWRRFNAAYPEGSLKYRLWRVKGFFRPKAAIRDCVRKCDMDSWLFERFAGDRFRNLVYWAVSHERTEAFYDIWPDERGRLVPFDERHADSV